MCGIYGEWSRNVNQGTPSDVARDLTRLMVRRGPDDSGIWTDGRRCQLGFQRLSILDISPAGHQPMTAHQERFALVFNGEIYNHRQLRDELVADGVTFRSSGDTETLLHGLIRWGSDVLTKLNGMFAFAFYDAHDQSLLLARDHAGIKPLYVADTVNGIVFGSQLNLLISHPWLADHAVDHKALTSYLSLGYIPAPQGLVQGTTTLEPGTCLRIAPDRTPQVDRYFELPVNPTPDLSGDEANEAVDAAVTNAVERQLISDVPIGCFLSGGVDSPLVAAKIAAVHGRVPVFTIGTGGDKFDESHDAQTYARHLNHAMHLRHITNEQAIGMLEELVDATTEPLADVSMFPTLFVSRLASEHAKVVLSGDGGDELFWGYAGRFAAALRRGETFAQSTVKRRAKWLGRRVLGKKTPFHETLGEWYQYKHSKLREPWLSRAFPTVTAATVQHDAFRSKTASRDSLAQWLRWNEFQIHLPMVLQKVDRASMHHSIEVRVPLLDREVIDVATRVDWQSCLDMQAERGKLPLRHALKRHVDFQTARKRGFTIAINDWLRGPLRDHFADVVLARNEVLGMAMDRATIELMFREHQSNTRQHGSALWLILVLCLWADRHYHQRKHLQAA